MLGVHLDLSEYSFHEFPRSLLKSLRFGLVGKRPFLPERAKKANRIPASKFVIYRRGLLLEGDGCHP